MFNNMHNMQNIKNQNNTQKMSFKTRICKICKQYVEWYAKHNECDMLNMQYYLHINMQKNMQNMFKYMNKTCIICI
jgi:hypothetical protein